MASRRVIARYRGLYAKLLSLYPKPYRERFAEGMGQTFNDLCRERQAAGAGLFPLALWVFMETSAGIIRERRIMIMMQNITKRLAVWAAGIAAILMIPLVAMQFTSEVVWDLSDFVIMGVVLSGLGLAYELIARRSGKTVYRAAFSVGLVAAFLLFWVNGAVGIIGNEGQPANLLFGAVFVVGFIGSIMARFKPSGMSRTLFAAAIAQMAVPVIALMVWPPPATSWSPGVFRVFIMSAFFASLFVASGVLFQNAADDLLEAETAPEGIS